MREPTRVRLRRTRGLTRRLTLAAALGGLVLGAVGPALADDRPFAVSPLRTSRPDALPSPEAGGGVQAARLRAKASGKPVTVDELTTETSLTVANADGSLTLTTHLQAARVKKDGAWTPVDARLAKNPDGTWSPHATPSGISLSNGGSGPLATLTDRVGHSLALTFPMALPAPTVNAAGAKYADVLPGVDLQVDVSDQGALREVLVVRNAAAAANPALRTLRVGTSAEGLTVSSDVAGNLAARTAEGGTVFNAPTPVMWDSATTAAPAPGAGAGKSAGAQSAADGPAAGATSSTKDVPGTRAHVRPVAVRADATSLTLTPDAGLLGGGDTVWPLYIDPSFTPTAPMGTNHYAQVMEGCPDSPQYDVPQANGEGVGYQHYQTNCYGMERSYFEIDTHTLNHSMVIGDANLYLSESYGANWSCSAQAPVTLKWTKGISSATKWTYQPDIVQELGTQWPTSAAAGCGSKPVVFPVTAAVQSVVQQGLPNWTVGLFGDETRNTTSNLGFMRFNTNPYVIATYDLPPNTPDAMYTSPDAQNPSGAACGGGQPGWIGMTTLAGNTSNITLHAYASTPMAGNNLVVGFHVWDNMANDGNGSPATLSWPVSSTISSSAWGSANIGGQVSDGHQYGWNAWGSDGLLGSPNSLYCYFDVDLTPPSLAAIDISTAFPPLGSGIAPTAHAGDPGATIRVSSNDPTPGGCNLNGCVKSGVRGFQYSLDDNIPAVGANTVAVTADANGTAVADIPVSVNPDQWGTHTLYVRAVDGAGNTQPQAAVYSFYAPWNPATKVVPGDLTFDGTPDFLSPAPDGSLTLVPGNSDFSATPGLASTANQSPEHDSWNNYLIAHRGSLTQSSVDDLFAYNKGTHKLYAYFNDSTRVPAGTAGHFSLRGISQLGASTACPAGIDGTWNNLTQMIAPGAQGNPNGLAGLITVESGHLRFYQGSLVGGCLIAAGTELGDGDWSAVTLLAPGTVGGTPTLWARDNTTGAINSYPLTFDAAGAPTTILHAPVHQPLVSAVRDTAGLNMCADIPFGGTDNGTKAELWNCTALNPAQALTRGTDGTLHVLGKCLDVRNSETANGALVQLWDCNNTGAQKWETGPFPATLRNPESGRCLAVPSGDNTPGRQLIIWDCLNDSSQNWVAGVPGGALLAPQPVLPVGISTAAYPRVDSPGDANGDGNPDLFTTDNNGVITQIPGIAPVGAIARFANPITLGAANRPVGYHLQSVHNPGKCLDNYGPSAGADLVLWDCWNGISQKFAFAPDGTLRTGGLCVSTRANGTGNGTQLATLDCQGDTGQVWLLRADGSLYNPQSNRCLELPGWATANGTVTGIWDCNGNPNQRWTLTANTA